MEEENFELAVKDVLLASILRREADRGRVVDKGHEVGCGNVTVLYPRMGPTASWTLMMRRSCMDMLTATISLKRNSSESRAVLNYPRSALSSTKSNRRDFAWVSDSLEKQRRN